MNNKFMHYSGVLAREYVSLPTFYLAILLFFLLCAFSPIISIEEAEYSVLQVLTDRTLYKEVCTDLQCNSYALALGYNGSPWFPVIVPVITSFPAFLIYEQNSSAIRTSILSRIRTRTYCNGLFFLSFVSGFFIALCSILLYVALVYAAFPSITTFPQDIVAAVYGASPWERFLPMLKKVLNCCLMCGSFPIVTLIFYHLVHDRFLSITLPMMVQYISLKCGIVYESWLYDSEARANDVFLNLLEVAFPSNCIRDNTERITPLNIRNRDCGTFGSGTCGIIFSRC